MTNNTKETPMRKFRMIALVAIAIGAVSCPGDLFSDCGEVRFQCGSNNTIQFCNAEGKWELWRDCASVGEVCTAVPSSCGGFAGPCCD